MFGYPPSLLSVDFQIVPGQDISGVNQLITIPANPDRFSLAFIPTTAGPFYVGPSTVIGPTVGFPVSSNLNPYIFTYNEWGPLVTLAWTVGTTGPGQTVRWYEVIYKPRED